MTYGGVSLSPVPIMTLAKDTFSNKDGRIGQKYSMTLNGTLSTAPTLAGGLPNIDSLQDSLIAAFASDGQKFELSCGGSVMMVCYPKLVGPISFQPSNNNWYFTTPYTIELEFEDYRGDDNKPYVEQASESWSVEFIEDSPQYCLELSGVTNQTPGYYYGKDCNYIMMRVSHSLNAVGQQHFIDLYGTGTGVSGAVVGTGVTGYLQKDAWQYARDWCTGRLGFDETVIQDSGTLNLGITGVSGVARYGTYNHMRGVTRSETQGTYSVDENWIVTMSGSGNTYSGDLRATEDFTINVEQTIENPLTAVSVQGQIQGWETKQYGITPGDFLVTETKMQAAELYWSTILLRILPRAQLYYQQVASGTLNVLPMAKTVGYSPSKGTISYNYSYDDRPSNCISGALSESITVDSNYAVDVFASIPILGRPSHLTQDLGIYTNPTLTVTVECTMPPATGCGLSGLMAGIPRTQVNSLLCDFQTDLTGHYDSVYVIENKEVWLPKVGKYTRTMGWLYTLCSGSSFTGVC